MTARFLLRPTAPSLRPANSIIFPLLLLLVLTRTSLTLADAVDATVDATERGNATEALPEAGGKDSFADIIDRALQKEFPESEQNGQETNQDGFNNSVAEKKVKLCQELELRLHLFWRFCKAFPANAAGTAGKQTASPGVCRVSSRSKEEKPQVSSVSIPSLPLLSENGFSTRRLRPPQPRQIKP
ncbi:K(+) efflux antiporter 4 [Platanthera guangdongensis]|uniref:K(+) efflux antiporter 4 n=1 Tax=Platanthera guangdongensis TaxID=2320717 RepID=A0ABR2N2U0_9ASPA